ncbi:MAG TPA: hypothetical protein VEF76_01280 [Patescibacteria group bacterium]|nr:hypothetical protein [Patescibacteria group bacterium]
MKILPVMTAALVAVALSAAPAIAKNNGKHGKGHGNSHGNSHHETEWEAEDDDHGHGEGKHKGHSSSHDRDVLRGYVIGQYKKHCPPGLAKKNPPCIPPGQAKKYGVGQRLPEGAYQPVPVYIVEQLTPPPDYARYVRVDQNVYLIAEGSRKIIEAFELFSAVR